MRLRRIEGKIQGKFLYEEDPNSSITIIFCLENYQKELKKLTGKEIINTMKLSLKFRIFHYKQILLFQILDTRRERNSPVCHVFLELTREEKSPFASNFFLQDTEGLFFQQRVSQHFHFFVIRKGMMGNVNGLC